LDNSAIPPAVVSFNTTCAAAALPVGHKAVESRQIDITLTGSVVGDAAVTKTLTSTVKVRNDRIFTQ
jgi:type IV pilus assembly protein PilW